MDEERFKIMQMLADGTITTDEADLLLEALEAAPAEPSQRPARRSGLRRRGVRCPNSRPGHLRT